MIGRRDDGQQDPSRVGESKKHIESSPELILPPLPGLERPAQDARMVQHGAADEEGVAEMHGRHGGERVDVVPLHPHALPVVVADGVEEAVLAR